MIQWKDLKEIFLNESQPVLSLFYQLTLVLVLWSVNPQSLYYSWKVWGGLMLLWLGLAVWATGGDVIRQFFSRRIWILMLWPLYNLVMSTLGVGAFYNRQISIAFTMLIPCWFFLFRRTREMTLIAKLAVGYIGLIAVVSLTQFFFTPNIARDLAGIEKGYFRASPLLGNFHTVYEAIPLTVLLAGGLLLIQEKRQRMAAMVLALALCAFVLLSQYDIAMLTLVLYLGGLLLVVIWRLVKIKTQGSSRQRIRTEAPDDRKNQDQELPDPNRSAGWPAWIRTNGWLTAFLVYSSPAVLLLLLKAPIDRLIYLMDLRQLAALTKLVNRLRVYLKSVVIFQEHPLLGISPLPDRTLFDLGNHSDYFDLLAEYGLVGFILFLSTWLFLVILTTRNLPVKGRWTFLLALSSFHLVFFVNPVVDVSSVIVLFFILPGLLWDFAGPAEVPMQRESELLHVPEAGSPMLHSDSI